MFEIKDIDSSTKTPRLLAYALTAKANGVVDSMYAQFFYLVSLYLARFLASAIVDLHQFPPTAISLQTTRSRLRRDADADRCTAKLNPEIRRC
jgi:hypothetical protein